MESTQTKLEQYNEHATIMFVRTAIKLMPQFPIFRQMYLHKDWKGAYQTLAMFKATLPAVVEIYNVNYQAMIIKSN